MPTTPAPAPTKAKPNTDATDEQQDPKKQGALNSPEVDQQGKPTRRAIDSPLQAWTIAKNIRRRAVEGRLKTAAIVASKYNGDAPFDPKKLEAAGQGWRNNFSTNFLASIVDRVKPQLLDPVHKAGLLTHSTLPASIEEGAAKSRKFCEVTTRTVRGWAEWKDFMSRLAQEVVLYGVGSPGWMDKNEWRPHLWKFDETFFPEGTGQHAKKVQVAPFYQAMLVHDFIKLIEDPEAANKAGYNIEGCRKAANKARNLRNSSDPTPVENEDAAREGYTLADSMESETRVVKMYHVVVQDYTGEVDLWTVDFEDGTELRQVKDVFDGGGMDDAATLFTFQSGNGKFYGSKGLGRLLTNLHVAIERGRNLGADQMYLSGLVIGRVDKMNAIHLQTKVRHPFIFVDKNVEIASESITFNYEAFLAMDAKLVTLANSIAGAFIPPNLDNQGSPNTKIEAAQQAERELAVKEGVLGRFFDHLGDLVSAMQRKIYSPDNLREAQRIFDERKQLEQKGLKVLMRKVYALLQKAFGKVEGAEPQADDHLGDEDAVEAIVELLGDGLTMEEIAMLALTPSGANNADEGAEKDNRTLAYIQGNKVNPYVDQRKAAEMEAKIAIGDDRARELLIPLNDPNVENEAMRQQIIEFSEMMDGEPMPVVGSDRHEIHRKVLAGKVEPLMQAITTGAGDANLMKGARLCIAHYLEHLDADTLTSDAQKQEEAAHVQQWSKALDQMEAQMQKLAEQAAQAGQPAPGDLPAPVGGVPPQVGPDGNLVGENAPMPADDPTHPANVIDAHRAGMEGAAALADIDLRHRELDLRERDQDIKAADLRHRMNMDTHKANMDAVRVQQSGVKLVQDQANAEREQGLREAEADRQKNTPAEPEA